MKILLICESFPLSEKREFTGGVEKGDYFLARELAKKHQVIVFTGARKDAPSQDSLEKIQVRRLGIKSHSEKRESLVSRFSFLLMCLFASRKVDSQVVYGSNVFSQLITILISKQKQIPSVAKMADVYLGKWIKHTNFLTGTIGEILEKYTVTYFWGYIIAWSNTVKYKILPHNTRSKLIVIGGGLELDGYKNIVVSKYKKPTIVVASRLVKYKRVRDIIQAFSFVLEKIPDARLEIIGDGVEMKSLEQLARENEIINSINFRGFIKHHHKVVSIIKRSHLFCHASEVEGFGFVTLEALSCGVPFVHSDLKVTREITNNGKGGVFFSLGDTQNASQQIIRLLTDKRLYNQKVREAKHVVKKYSWEKVGQQTETVFKKAIKEHKE